MTTGTQLWHAFLDRYYPAPTATLIQPMASTQADLQELAGSYRSTRRSVTSFSKLLVLFDGTQGEITVGVGEDGTLRTEGLGPQPLHWVHDVLPMSHAVDGLQHIVAALLHPLAMFRGGGAENHDIRPRLLQARSVISERFVPG